LEQFAQRLASGCEREDLIGSGFVEKYVVEEIFKGRFKVAIPEIPK
jgi:hypothetical protein